MPNPIQALLEQISSGFRPTEGDYGMSPQADIVREALGAYQGAGEKPPLPGDEGGAPPMIQLIQFLQAMQGAQGDAGFRESPNPDPGFAAESPAGALQALNSPTSASANSPDNLALLQALLGQ